MEGDRVRRVDPTPEISGVPQTIHVVGHQAIWEDWPGLTGTRLVGATLDEGPSVLWAPEGWDVKRSFARPDGVVAWTQSRNRLPEGPYAENELWRARMVDGGLTEASFVRSFASGDVPSPVDGAELYSDRSRVYDLDRGTGFLIDHPESISLSKLLASSPEELFFIGGVGRESTFIRLDRATYLVDGTSPGG